MALWRVRSTMEGPNVVGGGVCDLYFDSNVGSTQQAFDAVVAFWIGANDAYRVDTIITVDPEVYVLTAAGVITGIDPVTPTSSIAGTDDSDALPPQTQSLVRWRTGAFSNGREVRGRTFIPSAGEAYSVAGKPGGARLTELINAADALVNDAESQLLVWSRTHQVAFPVISSSVWDKFAVLRSRRD